MVPIDPVVHETILRGILGFGLLGYIGWNWWELRKAREK